MSRIAGRPLALKWEKKKETMKKLLECFYFHNGFAASKLTALSQVALAHKAPAQSLQVHLQAVVVVFNTHE